MQLKLTRAVQCLYGVAAIHALSLAYAVLSMIELKMVTSGMAGISPLGFMSAAYAWPVMMLAAIYFVVQNLKKENEWAWVGALSVFVFSIPSFGIVFSIFGIMFLIDKDVRTIFLKKLDVQI